MKFTSLRVPSTVALRQQTIRVNVIHCVVMGLAFAAAACLAEDPAWYTRRAMLRETFESAYAAAGRSARESSPEYGPWHVIAPFPNADGKGFETAYPPEREINLAAEYPGAGNRPIRWQRRDDFRDGAVNNLKIFETNDYVCAYLFREIVSPTAQALPVELGSDDTITIWLNGRRLLANRVARPCRLGDERLVLPLQPGTNSLLLKICQGNLWWGFAFAAQPGTPPLARVMALLRRDFPEQGAEIGLLEESLAQAERIEGLRSGLLKASRFATPEHAHRTEALLRTEDRDAADVTLRRVEALLTDLRNMKGSRDLSAEAQSIAELRRRCRETPLSDLTGRLSLYLDCCEVRRRIAFANPLLDFDRILFVKHKKNGRQELGGDHMAGQYYGIHATKGEGLFVL
ncbi:MAG: hypothetical protein WCJ02_16590 [bacterium]